ncbi:MAG: hypothetical protein LBU23_08635 [Planctomycetota bacterium]|jgi:hypothetical protein|nr:hypothetical protein [Planctomycetota bacterium]
MEANAPVRKPRGFKIALAVITILFFLFAAAIYFLPYILPIDAIRGITKTKAREMLGMDLDFKSLGFGWNGSLVLEGIVLAPEAKEGEAAPQPLLSVAEVRTNVSMTALLSGKIVVNSLIVNGFEAKVRRGADGALNLPDFSRLAAVSRPERRSAYGQAALLSALAAETASLPANAMPDIEIHRLELNRGGLSFEDTGQGLLLRMGVDFIRIDGGALNDPFTLAGRVLAYPDSPEDGEFSLNGKVALIRDNAFNPAGEAIVEIAVKSFAPGKLAGKLGLGGQIASGAVNGLIKLAYADGKAKLGVSDFEVAGAALNLGTGGPIALPDSKAGLAAEFDPGKDVVSFANLTLANKLASLEARGRLEGAAALADGGIPTASLDFSGNLDFAGAAAFLAGLDLGLPELPELRGTARFSGLAALPGQTGQAAPTPTLMLDFSEGELEVLERVGGIGINLGLAGIGVKATASLGASSELNANLTLQDTAISARIPEVAEPVRLRLHGTAAANLGNGGAAAELRFADAELDLPATPWAAAMRLRSPETSLTYSLAKDELSVAAMSLNLDGVGGGAITSAAFAGLAAGKPRGQAEMKFSASLEPLRQLLLPLLPPETERLAGDARGEIVLKMAHETTQATLKAEIAGANLVLNLPPGQAGAASPKTNLALSASLDFNAAPALNLESLAIDSSGGEVGFKDLAEGLAASGKLGETQIRLAGRLDAESLGLALSRLEVASRGLEAVLERGGKRVAGLSAGLMRISSGNDGALFPLSGAGDFKLPAFVAGTDRLLLSFLDGGRRSDSDFGTVKIGLGVDGHVGGGGRQLVTVRTASLSAKTLAANARGKMDLGSGELALEYAAAIAPAEMASLFGILNLPPALLARAQASGALTWNGTTANSKGTIQGQLGLAAGEANPFEFNHEIAASRQADAFNLVIRRLDGNVKSASGEAAVTLAAQPANLSLNRRGANGGLDLRLSGAAGPTRTLVLGLAGIFPQLREYSALIHNSQVGGVYQAELRIGGKDDSPLTFGVGALWRGAALSLDNAPQLAEAGTLKAILQGEYSFAENRLRLSRLLFQSDSGQMTAGGAADMILVTDSAGFPSGLASVNLDLNFSLGDAAKTALVFPGVLKPDLELRGRVEGALKAAGNASDIRIGEGGVRFQDFQVKAGGIGLAIPSGTAILDAVLSLRLDRSSVAAGTVSPYAALRLVDVRDGRASLAGAVLDGKPVDVLSGEFQLESGVLTLKSGQAALGGGAGGEARAAGKVDFNSPAPAVEVRLAARNVQLALVNSQLVDYMIFVDGALNLPADAGQTAGVAFSGFSEDEILKTLRLDNFSFATGPITLNTGPVLNAELDKARGLMRQEVLADGESKVITLKSVTGLAAAGGDGVISFTASHPIRVEGDNTGDFQVEGRVSADHTMDMDFYVIGKLENLIGFSLPNLIPNLRSNPDEARGFMVKMNQNAANRHYKVNVSGRLDAPNLSGIGLLAGVFLKDMFAAAPAQIIGGVLNLAKDAPGTIINAPQNITRNLGKIFGLEAGGGGEGVGGEAAPEPGAEQPSPSQPRPQQRGLRLPFSLPHSR